MLQLILWPLLLVGKSSSVETSTTAIHVHCQENTIAGLLAVNCTGQGLTQVPNVPNASNISYLSVEKNEIKILESGAFGEFPALINLSLVSNEISFIQNGAFAGLRSLKQLDLRTNKLTGIHTGMFSGLLSLQILLLSSNSIVSIEDGSFHRLSSLTELDLGFNKLTATDRSTFGTLANLVKLSLYQNEIATIQSESFHGLPSLQVLDLGKNKLEVIGPYAFHGLPSKPTVFSDDSDFCCIVGDSGVFCQEPTEAVYMHDGYRYVKIWPLDHPFNVEPTFSSCRNLIHNTVMRIFIWTEGIFAVVCNVAVILWRLLSRYQAKNRDINENQRKSRFLSICLASGDLCMGAFLLVIASADQVYRGYYVLQDEEWRRSSWCSLAGFLSAFSSEFTIFILTVITIDRCYAITYPTRKHILDSFYVMVIAAVLLIVSALLAAAPLMTSKLPNFYNISAVCLALPFSIQPTTSSQNSTLKMAGPSRDYSISVFIGLNSILVLTILVCYAKIFIETMKSNRSTTNTAVNTEAKMGRRIMTIIGNKILCWLPIIALGFTSAAGFDLSPQVYYTVAAFILPINSSANPLIYTFYTRQFRQAISKTWRRLGALWSFK